MRGGSSFGVVRWPPDDGELCLAVRRDGGVQLVSAASGEDVATFADAHGADDGLASLDLGGSFGRVLAEGQTLSATGRRAVLRLLHPERGLLYEEALAVPYLGLAVIPADMTGGPALVVAGGDAVSVYEAR